eukprot:768368-Hanusia_phi.AAC.5
MLTGGVKEPGRRHKFQKPSNFFRRFRATSEPGRPGRPTPGGRRRRRVTHGTAGVTPPVLLLPSFARSPGIGQVELY